MFNNTLLKLIKIYPARVNWTLLLPNKCLTVDFIEKYIKSNEIIDWFSLSSNENLTPEFIKKYQNELNWDILSSNLCLTIDLINT